jgi:hypothetical protein
METFDLIGHNDTHGEQELYFRLLSLVGIDPLRDLDVDRRIILKHIGCDDLNWFRLYKNIDFGIEYCILTYEKRNISRDIIYEEII